MIFDMTANANGRKLPTVNPDYPLDQTVTFIQGNTASAVFEARIAKDGRPTLYSYQWYLDGEAVSGATSSSFQFNGISASGKHTLYCVITNAAGSVQTRTATLTADMYYTPVLDDTYPADASVVVNGSVTCKVEISTAGNPASYTYQWYADGSPIAGYTSPTATITLTSIGSCSIYCIVTNAAGSVQSRTATITSGIVPQFSYTGSYKLLDDSGNTITTSSNVTNWRIKFLTSGTLKFTNLFSAANGIDIFCVGGGGGGDASGGCGGKTTTAKAKTVTAGTSYTVTVGAGGAAGKSGGNSSFGSLASAAGGGGPGGAGGSGGGGSGLYITSSNKANGGKGGSNGANGVNGYGTSGFKNGTGQGSTTREFGSSSGTLYAGGGGGAGDYDCNAGSGGSGGGGAGGSIWSNGSKAGGAGTTNLGGGGGGGSTGGKGGSGIVIIRNKR